MPDSGAAWFYLCVGQHCAMGQIRLAVPPTLLCCALASRLCMCVCVQADTLGVPMVDEDRSHFLALVNAGVGVSWDGHRIVAPPGVVDEQGMCDLEPYMPGNFKRESKKKQ